jgi:endonuclease/exonuclease/phosphatase family metal-dependent hydrolase
MDALWFVLLVAPLVVHASALPPVLMSFNIRSGTGMDGRYDLARTASVIKAQRQANRSLLVGVQEVDELTQRHPVDQPSALARATGLHATFARMRDFVSGSSC